MVILTIQLTIAIHYIFLSLSLEHAVVIKRQMTNADLVTLKKVVLVKLVDLNPEKIGVGKSYGSKKNLVEKIRSSAQADTVLMDKSDILKIGNNAKPEKLNGAKPFGVRIEKSSHPKNNFMK